MKRTCLGSPRQRLALALATATLLASGCATQEQTGAVTGGVIGGLAGSTIGSGSGRSAAIVAGTIAGALIGGAVGKSMDAQDRQQARQALEYGRTNEPYAWRNPDTGVAYTVTPVRTYENHAGVHCREYYTDAVVDGRRERIYGTACRQPDGSWQSTG
jgi:surface antigen